MQKLKKVFKPGGEQEDEVMYGSGTSATGAPQISSGGQSAQKDPGMLGQVLDSSDGTRSQQASTTAPTTAPQQRQNVAGTSNLPMKKDDHKSDLSVKSGTLGPYAAGADIPLVDQRAGTVGSSAANPGTAITTDTATPTNTAGVAGTGVVPTYEGIAREDTGDDVTQSTYTARAYRLPTGTASTPQGPSRTVVEDSRPPTDDSNSNYIRDSSLAGAGTIIGSGAVGAGALAAQENKPKDPQVDQATYTDRAFAVGGPSSSEQTSELAARQADIPHMPGEFPADGGEDPHEHNEPANASGAQSKDSGLGSGSAVAAGLGAGAVGAGAAGAGYAATRSNDEPKSSTVDNTTSTRSNGQQTIADNLKSGTPTQSANTGDASEGPLNSRKHEGAGQSESNTGRNAAIGGAAATGAGAAGYGAYEASKDTNTSSTSATPGQSTIAGGASDGPLNSQKHEGTSGSESNTGRNAALGGVGAAGAGAAGYGAYEASKSKDTTTSTTPGQSTIAGGASDGPLNSQKHEGSESNTGRDAAIGGVGAAGTGAAGYGAYEASQGSSEPTILRDSNTVENKPEDENHYGRNAAIAGGGAAATGAAGYGAYEYMNRDKQQEEQSSGPHQSALANKLDPRAKHGEQKAKDDEKAREEQARAEEQRRKQEEEMARRRREDDERRKKEEETQYARDAAIVGGAGGAGAAGAGAYAATRDNEESPAPESPNNKTAVDSSGRTRLHKKSEEEQGEKKPSVLSKILHPNKHKRESEGSSQGRPSEEQRSSQADSRPSGVSSENQRTATQGDDGVYRTPSGNPVEPSSDMITLTHEGADPNAPHVVVTDRPT